MGNNTGFGGEAGVFGASKSLPTLSVILPVWNGQSFVADAISSVLLQSFEDFELQVADEG